MSKTKAEIAGHVYDLGKLEYFLRGGLVEGAGDSPERGNVCVEQAVALCAGLPIRRSGAPTDRPSCVLDAAIEFGQAANDAWWGSDAERANALRRFAFAQLGTAGLSDAEFDRKVVRAAREADLLDEDGEGRADSASDAVAYLRGGSKELRKLANIAADVCCAMRKAEGIKVKPVTP